jgi:hypothetical protein
VFDLVTSGVEPAFGVAVGATNLNGSHRHGNRRPNPVRRVWTAGRLARRWRHKQQFLSWREAAEKPSQRCEVSAATPQTYRLIMPQRGVGDRAARPERPEREMGTISRYVRIPLL